MRLPQVSHSSGQSAPLTCGPRLYEGALAWASHSTSTWVRDSMAAVSKPRAGWTLAWPGRLL